MSQNLMLLAALDPKGSNPDAEVTRELTLSVGVKSMGTVKFQALLRAAGKRQGIKMPFNY